MIRPLFYGLLLPLILLSGGLAQTAPKPLFTADSLGKGPVYLVDVQGLIDNGLATYIERAVAEAEEQKARLIIFHVDTFGGLVDAADRIRQIILDTSVPTLAFIDKNAASAGALIAYAADRVVMVPGASIGAATVVEGGTGKAAPDKYQSYMRAQMRATAEANGRDPRIAEAMVDQSLELPGIVEKGKVLTLSAQEAVRLGVADAVKGSLDELLKEMGVEPAEVQYHHASWGERVLRFLSSPIVSSILMLMMLGGLYFELQTPGVGFPGIMAAIGATLFFAPHYMLGLVESWELVLFFVGVILLLVEILVIPGFGLAGISGLTLILLSLLAGLIGNVGLQFPGLHELAEAIWTMVITLVLFVAMIVSVGRYLPRVERFNQLVLTPSLEKAAGYVAVESREELVGQRGETLTPLRPVGVARIGKERIDVVSAGPFLPAGVAVRVSRVEGNRVEVEPLNES